MDGEKAKEYLDYLEEKYTEWYSNPRRQSEIANEIRNVASRWDDDIYLFLNDGRATGLFEHGFFETDVERAFDRLQFIILKEKILAILDRMSSVNGGEDLVRKELIDYLREKIENNELSKKRIVFRDDEDKEYFEKLTQKIGVDAVQSLDELVDLVFS